MTWGSTTYDAQLNLIYFGTGNPQPVINGRKRQGDNLYTESIVALNPDTGQLAWYFQASPHDTHDWDATQTPVLFDGTINGQPRKLLAQAARNGFLPGIRNRKWPARSSRRIRRAGRTGRHRVSAR